MSDNLWDDDDQDQDQQSEGNLVKQLRSALKAKDKELATLREQNVTLTKSNRQRTVADVLASKKLDPKVAKLVPESVEPTPEAVTAWLDEYADIFGLKAKDDDAQEGDDETQASEDLAALQRISRSTAGAVPTGKIADQMAAIQRASSVEELNALLGI